MARWLKRARGILGMGMVWGGAGALLGMAIEVVNGIWPNPLSSLVDMWPVALGLPAFLTGAASAAALGIVARARRFDELSAPGFAALGGLGGLVVAVLPWPLTALGLVPAGFNLWPVAVSIAVPFALVGAVVAPGTLALARLKQGPTVDEVHPTEARIRLSGPDA